MIYLMSDIHGCYNEYKAMLDKINFCENDTLYMLGDVVDRGDEPMKILLDIMDRDNIIPILGNHDYVFNRVVETIPYNCTIDDFMADMDDESLQILSMWVMDGGRKTLEKYIDLSIEDKRRVLNYVDTFSLYKEINVNGTDYLLTHSGLDNFKKSKALTKYGLMDFIYHRPAPDEKFFDDTMLIFGHTPTLKIDIGKPIIYKTPHYINIDCGCVYGGALGCLDLTNMKEYYV